MTFNRFGITQIQKHIALGQLSCSEIVETCLAQINEGAHYNAFISVFGERSLKKAEEIDVKIKENRAGKLAGTVLAIKDNIVIKGERVTCGSRILENFVSPYDATVIRKLEAEDVIIIGKTNMDEFAMGSSNENSYFGAVKNPNDVERVPGGSSGGSCTAVAGGLCTAALGSDTGGSIRQPASFCGVVGLKPTYGRVSRFGLVAFASSFDQIGPITQTVEDAASLLKVISGNDDRDATTAQVPVPDFLTSLGKSVTGLRIGWPDQYFNVDLNQEVRQALEAARDFLQENGAQIVPVSLPHTDYAIAAYYILATAEASANLARYDGARYGFRAEGVENLEEMYVESRSLGFGDEVKRRIMLGTYVLSAGYYDAYYGKGQKVRTLIKQDFERAFEQCDCLLTPTCPTTAFKLGEKAGDAMTMYLSDVYTVSANLAGLPAISIPCGLDAHKMPIGAQIIGKYFDEAAILGVANFLEKGINDIK